MSLAEMIAPLIPTKAKNVVITVLLIVAATLITCSPLNPHSLNIRVTQLEVDNRTVVAKLNDISRYLCVVDYQNAQLSGIPCRELVK